MFTPKPSAAVGFINPFHFQKDYPCLDARVLHGIAADLLKQFGFGWLTDDRPVTLRML